MHRWMYSWCLRMLEFDSDDDMLVGDEILREFADCLDCGLCCRFFDSLPLYDVEIQEIASFLSIDRNAFLEEYTKSLEEYMEGCSVSLNVPCPFQKDNSCMIYEKRGFICRMFPLCINHTKNKAVLSGIFICPQATQFYIAMMEFYKVKQPNVYKILLEKERSTGDISSGLTLEGDAILFSCFIDSFMLKK